MIRQNSSKIIKEFIIDQNIIKGIGNAYADEILWKAMISPHSTSGKIPEEVVMELNRAIPEILKDAIQKIKEISPEIISGEVRSFLKVHNTEKKLLTKAKRY